MALQRSPTSIQVNGAALLVKDPTADDGLFSTWQRVPGLASFTLPDETGATTETQLMDGSISFAQIAGVGTITGSIGAVTGHPTHRFLADKRRSGGTVTIAIIRPSPGNVFEAIDNAASAAAIVSDAGYSVISVVDDNTSGSIAAVKAGVREGTLVALHTGAPAGYALYGDAAVATMAKWQSVVRIDADSGKFWVSPGVSSAIAAASGTNLYARRPGVLFDNISCTVNGFGDGDFQAGGAMNANVSFAPGEALPALTPYTKVLSEMGTDFNSAFAAIS